MVGKKRISVAMVSYNGEKYIKEQLDSILVQLGETDEVVISDDGSCDSTREIIEEYRQRDDRIRVVDGPRQGIKRNVAYALEQCQGEIIFLADQDDVWKPHKVQRVSEVLEQGECTLVIHDAEVFREDPNQVCMKSFFAFRKANPGVFHNIVRNSYIGCCMAFRRELLDRALPIPDTIEMHDQWLGIVSDFYFGKSTFLREPLLSYRRHEENNSAMKHYGVMKMVRNRAVFCLHFLGRIIHIC